MSICEVLVTSDPLSPPAPAFSGPFGAVLDFYGVVRALEDDRSIEGIEYEAFVPMAERQMKLITEKAASDHHLGEVLLHHRIGFVPVGEASLYLRVTARHRGAAYAASKAIVERLKMVVPIWKHPVFSSIQIA
jgi:molybdopterin synthase catalytic subunit